LDSSDNLYGTTYGGGAHNIGTVFKLSLSFGTWTESVLYSFKGGSDGDYPSDGGLIIEHGVLYGVTGLGGGGSDCPNGCGTVFKLVP
jgi:uncharacterized repeat protein (TIGR03803 family)